MTSFKKSVPQTESTTRYRVCCSIMDHLKQ